MSVFQNTSVSVCANVGDDRLNEFNDSFVGLLRRALQCVFDNAYRRFRRVNSFHFNSVGFRGCNWCRCGLRSLLCLGQANLLSPTSFGITFASLDFEVFQV